MILTQQRLLLCTAVGLATLASGCALFHKKPAKSQQHPMAVIDPAKKTADSLRKAHALKPYGEIITKDTRSQAGFFTVHKRDTKYYFEIPNNLLNREILIVSRIAKASADMRSGTSGYAGDEIGESVYRFEMAPDNKMMIRRMSYSEYSKDSTQTMFAGVQKNNVGAIMATFPVLALKKDSSARVIDVTDFLNADNEVLYFQKAYFKTKAGVSGQQADKSYIDYVHAFPKNVEIKAVKTYGAGLNPTNTSYTLEINSSMVLLPVRPMKARALDERVGYFSTSFRDYDTDPQGVKNVAYVKRWDLQPKPEDVEKYKRGELVEPAKQIVFYIDPVTPKKWVPYLIQGVNDWQKAFEAAGFKNAIIAKEAPTKQQDSTWSIDDANHNAIIYRPSVVANAMGPSVADPRSGEIIESHIFWYHNVMDLLQRWYRIQAGAVDPRAGKQVFDDELMGQLIRFVSSHEVGHTLGLMHNFGSSSTVPVEKLRDKAWVEAHGHTPSIMDYARFNYVAQPEDHIGDKGMFPRIGDYDKWAIKWGYTWRPEFNTAEEEKNFLTKMVTDSLKANHRLLFGFEGERADPRSQSEDMGDDAMKASVYGIKNLKRIIPKLDSWVSQPGESQEKLFKIYSEVWDQWERYNGHVMKNLGGTYHTPRVNGESGAIYAVVPYEKQKAAMKYLDEQVFETPLWLNYTPVVNKLNVNFNRELSEIQQEKLAYILHRERFTWMLDEQLGSKTRTYTVKDMLYDMEHSIFKEVYAGKNVDVYRRTVQKLYLYRLLEQTFNKTDMDFNPAHNLYHFSATDLSFILKQDVKALQVLLGRAAKKPGINNVTRLHLQDMVDVITSKLAAERNGLTAK
ncbi:zinc-dependent metalloprotease [Mucilaginibacter paludis]|uniref:Peptidase M10A and M12B matrixin and adamalysin n=1 Tax=Mucilaginibacter paludis DSM 18603 TaxID=714943 RepID=H1YEY6_9SPHI|nr:zinc-dependent metalloprotease [Mucilaginibacter paludis]EHQ25239.1 hypothetical protein Mucpa_1067 [Mucilaginibacter paludis DSM 18603]